MGQAHLLRRVGLRFDTLILMGTRSGQWMVAGLLMAGMAGAAQTAGVDAALLAKANGGDATAQVAVGQAYEKSATKPGYAQAAAWYLKAANQGNIGAEVRLAALYRDGRGVARDMAQAADWYRKAADQGDVSAQGTLGLLYSIGQGVPRSDVEAYYWLALAAAAKGPEQEKYAANRQSMAARITADELEAVQDRVAQWLAAHPRPPAAD
jgi:TPR repeat protein